MRGTREIRNIMSRWFTSFAVEKKLGHMNQNDIGRRHCQTYNFRAFLYFEGIYGISFFFSRSSSPPSFLLFHVSVFIFSFPSLLFCQFQLLCLLLYVLYWSTCEFNWLQGSCLEIKAVLFSPPLAKARRIEDENQQLFVRSR